MINPILIIDKPNVDEPSPAHNWFGAPELPYGYAGPIRHLYRANIIIIRDNFYFKCIKNRCGNVTPIKQSITGLKAFLMQHMNEFTIEQFIDSAIERDVQ